MDFLIQDVFGNELWRWLAYGGVIFLSFLLTKTVSYFLSRVVPRLTRRTAFKADDLVVGAMKTPITLSILLSGIYFGMALIQYEGDPMT
ncbi:MAG: hypothetical protein KC561_16585, partial [Myxococcales bacterium]|nr:hypothetical protein [Myxococcales bacterium]